MVTKNLFSRRLLFFKLKKKITSVSSIIYIDSICQHNTPFVIDIAITCLSVPRDYILPYYTKMFDNSTSLIVNTYLERFAKDVDI